jgi:hypothetical protein
VAICRYLVPFTLQLLACLVRCYFDLPYVRLRRMMSCQFGIGISRGLRCRFLTSTTLRKCLLGSLAALRTLLRYFLPHPFPPLRNIFLPTLTSNCTPSICHSSSRITTVQLCSGSVKHSLVNLGMATLPDLPSERV